MEKRYKPQSLLSKILIATLLLSAGLIATFIIVDTIKDPDGIKWAIIFFLPVILSILIVLTFVKVDKILNILEEKQTQEEENKYINIGIEEKVSKVEAAVNNDEYVKL